MRQRRPQVAIGLDAVRVVRDPDLGEPEPLDHGVATHREEDLVSGDAAPVDADDRRAPPDELEAHHAGIRQDLDSLLLEVRLEQVAELLVLAVREVRPALDDRHLGAEPAVRLRELERHGAGADADEVARQLAHVHQVVARHRGDLVGARDVERPRSCAGRDQRVGEADAEVARLELVRADEARRQPDEVDAPLGEQALVVVGALFDDPSDPAHDRREVDLGARDADPELRCAVPDIVCDLGGPDQGFRGDASPGDSGAADRARLEQHHAGAAASGLEGGGDARHPSAEDCDVDRVARHPRPPSAVRGAGPPT